MSDDRSWFEHPPEPAEAERLFEAFVSGQDRRHRWFLDRARTDGLGTGYSAGDLGALVRWVSAQWEDDDPSLERPVWYGPVDRSGGMGTLGAALVDGLIAHVAAFIQALGGEWELRAADRPHDADALRPVMTVGTVPPWRLAQGAVARHRALNEDPSRLAGMLEDLAIAAVRPAPNSPSHPSGSASSTPAAPAGRGPRYGI